MIVIESKRFKFKYQKNIYRSIFFALLSTGLGFISAAFSFNWWELFILNGEKLQYNVEPFNPMQFSIGLFLIIVSIIFWVKREAIERYCDNKFIKELVVIKHQGLGEISLPDFSERIAGKSYKRYNRYEILIDDILFDRNKEYQLAINNINQKLVDNKRIIDKAHEVAYFGISRIPLVFFLANKFANNINASVFDYNRIKQKWDQVSYSFNKNFKGKKGFGFIKDETDIINSDSEDIVLTISVSYSVNIEETKKNVNAPFKRINLKIKNFKEGKLDRLNSKNEVNKLKNDFREVLDNISKNYPSVKTIHLFYSGPNSLAFSFGSIYSNSIHKNIIVYNYNVNDTPNYSWGIDINNDALI